MSALDQPAPLRIPAILQNPVNKTQKQVEAHNAQQREKVDAKRERERSSKVDVSGKGDRRGKRVIRRVDNAAFSSNPHIVRPSKSDWYPSYPLNPRPSLPMKTLPRSSAIPGVELPAKDPFSNDSVNGTFSTSLKGIRQALRKKGRRTEVVVQRVEDEIWGWLGGKGVLEAEAAAADSDNEDGSCGRWRVVDESLIESSFKTKDQVEGDGDNGPVEGSRRMPARHRLRGNLPPLPITDGTLPAILELSRSVGHLTWLAVEGFERLVIHLVCRYYELVSWSEDHTTSTGEQVRLTHIIRPAIAKPRPTPTGIMFTPENSDLSAPSSSDLSSANNTDNETSTPAHSDTEGDSDGTEMGESIDDEPVGYSLDAGPDGFEDLNIRSPTLESAMGELQVTSLSLGLGRTYSNSSSQYAESEGTAGSEYGMADSLGSLPPPPPGGWAGLGTFEEKPLNVGAGGAGLTPRRAGLATGQRATWEDKPSFFEYLYGA